MIEINERLSEQFGKEVPKRPKFRGRLRRIKNDLMKASSSATQGEGMDVILDNVILDAHEVVSMLILRSFEDFTLSEGKDFFDLSYNERLEKVKERALSGTPLNASQKALEAAYQEYLSQKDSNIEEAERRFRRYLLIYNGKIRGNGRVIAGFPVPAFFPLRLPQTRELVLERNTPEDRVKNTRLQTSFAQGLGIFGESTDWASFIDNHRSKISGLSTKYDGITANITFPKGEKEEFLGKAIEEGRVTPVIKVIVPIGDVFHSFYNPPLQVE